MSQDDRSIRDLAAELVEIAAQDPDRLGTRIAELPVRTLAELALRLPAERRLELLLNAPQPMRLVRALPDFDVYLTVRELGPADAIPMLALASSKQILHLLDLESWRRDRFDADRAGAWVALLVEAGAPVLRRFLRNADDEVLALLLQAWIRVEQIEYEDGAETHGHGEGEAGTEQGYLTPDGYYRFNPTIPEHTPAIRKLLQLFYVEHPVRYQRLLWEARGALGSELEEQALHWRQSRLEEHGFPRLDEAIDAYAPPHGLTSHPAPPSPTQPDALAASRLALSLLGGGGILGPTLDDLPRDSRERVLFETASLSNRLLVADGADAGEPSAHRIALEKAAGYVEIALSARGVDRGPEASRLLEQHPLVELFREGYARAVELQVRARRLVSDGWPSGDRDALLLLDAPVQDRVHALLESRPQYVEVFGPDQVLRRRDFRSLREIEETRVSVELAEVVGQLLIDRMGLDVDRVLGDGEPDAIASPTFGVVFLTVLAWHATRGEVRGDPLQPDAAADFLRTVASRRTASPDAPQRALDRLVGVLAESHRLGPRESSVVQAFGRFCLEKLADECAMLDPGVPIDSRHVSCLLLAGSEHGIYEP